MLFFSVRRKVALREADSCFLETKEEFFLPLAMLEEKLRLMDESSTRFSLERWEFEANSCV